MPISRSAVLGIKRVTIFSCHHNPPVIFSYPTLESVLCKQLLFSPHAPLSLQSLGASATLALPVGDWFCSLSTVSSSFILIYQPPYLLFFPFSEVVFGCDPPVLVFLVWSSLPSPLFLSVPPPTIPSSHCIASPLSIHLSVDPWVVNGPVARAAGCFSGRLGSARSGAAPRL